MIIRQYYAVMNLIAQITVQSHRNQSLWMVKTLVLHFPKHYVVIPIHPLKNVTQQQLTVRK